RAVLRLLVETALLLQMDRNHLAAQAFQDRKSTRLNSSHVSISYAVFCLKQNDHDRDHLRRHEQRVRGPSQLPQQVDSHEQRRPQQSSPPSSARIACSRSATTALSVRERGRGLLSSSSATTRLYTLSLHDALPIFARYCGFLLRPPSFCRWIGIISLLRPF